MGKFTWWYRVLCLAFLFLHFQVICSSSLTSHLCTHDQSTTLLQFKNSFVISDFFASESGFGFYTKTDSWKAGIDCCLWDGVTCDMTTGHVIGLDLSCNWLQGTIHSNSSLFLLVHLERLNLAFNDFIFSPIPPEFGRFSSLTHLNLSFTGFCGLVPYEISQLSKLVSLDLCLTGPVRFDQHGFQMLAQNLTKLRVLLLDWVNMSSVMPSSLLKLSSSLRSLSLSFTGLQGKFPYGVFQLPYLQMLSLAHNEGLTGDLPKSNWSSPVRFLDLSSTNFSGEWPDSIGNLKFLEVLSLRRCHFTGSIPASYGNLTKISYLDLSLNNFTGQLPSTFSNLEQLTHLDLSNNSFAGTIPDVFGSLSKLTSLSLSHNNFSGHLPLSAFNLTQLYQLNFSFNQIVGPLPIHVSGLSNLTHLDLSYNQLNETIPSWLFTSPSLVGLELSYNRFTGQLHEFKSKSLQYINLGNNQLRGPIPYSIFELVNLIDLTLLSNNLSGILELDLFSKLKNLKSLRLSHNNLSLITNSEVNSTWPKMQTLMLSSCNISEFPNFLRNQENLKELDLSNNKLHGHFPKWPLGMGKDSLSGLNLSQNNLTRLTQLPWVNLKYLDLCSNLLHGPLPVPPPSVNFFSIANNKLTGGIPSSFCHLSSLHILDLSSNNLSGTIPQCLGNLSNNLAVLVLRMNKFHGTIPGAFAKGNSLRTINLNDNQLEGPLPRALVNCRKLEVLDLSNNKIDDTFPDWLETLPELHVLVLRSNRFHGPIAIPKAKLPFPKLRIIDLSHNEFTGTLPSKYLENLKAMINVYEGKVRLYMGDKYYQDSVIVTMKGLKMELVRILTIFTAIDLSNNRFHGQIPEVVGKLNSLRGLNFSHNNLTGHIPSLLGNLTALESLDLSFNKLNGEIPSQLASLTFLAVFNVSQNRLVGPIPQGKQFNTFQNNSYFGNLGLCGFPLAGKCRDEEAPQPAAPKVEEDDDSTSGFDWNIIMMGYGCGLVFGLSMGYIVFSTGKPQWFVKMVEGVQHKRARRPNQTCRGRRF